MAAHNPVASLPVPGYFSHLAKDYSRTTANTTLDVFADVLTSQVQTSKKPIGASSIVHDNAAGPGVATAALFGNLAASDHPKEILVSDNNDGMLDGARGSFDSASVSYQNLDVHDLSSLPNDHFTHSITNFSIFTFKDAEKAMSEVHRTLAPGGQAIITSWRRFAVLPIVHAVQKALRPDLPLMPVPGPRFFDDGELEKVMATAGFNREHFVSLRKDILVTADDKVAGLKDFMTGSFMQRAKEGFSEEDLAKWPEAVDRAIKEEIEKYGGISFECFIVIATK